MLTIFSIPKPFSGHTSLLQRNAISSWTRVGGGVEVILLGDDQGVAEAASKYGVRHQGGLETNEYGTPLLSSAFRLATEMARHDILMYVNADIILVGGLLDAVTRVKESDFLLCGRRWDLDVSEAIDFGDPLWANKLWSHARTRGSLHGASGLDYFVFKRECVTMKAFAVGRPGWDGWLIYEMRRRGVPVIDCTTAIKAVHQNHDYAHSAFGRRRRVAGPELRANMQLAGGHMRGMTLREAEFVLGESGPKRQSLVRWCYAKLSLWSAWRFALAGKRHLMEVIRAD